ncbi:MAG: FtsX-like permease family protein [Bacteroidota bacterium]
MNILKISYKNLSTKGLTNGLSTLLMALGVGIISLILTVSKQLDEQFTNNIKGIDMVVGAKGSPLQLILSSIYQIDAPTGNINYAEAKSITKNPFIKQAIPVSVGDSYAGYRIVGSDSTYILHYKALLESGLLFKKPLECVVGNSVAKKLKLKIGDQLQTSHGLDSEGEKHEKSTYLITGILSYNNSVIDQLIITPLESVWNVHEHDGNQSNVLDLLEEEDHPEKKAEATNQKEITALLVKFRNPMGLMTIPRNINTNTNMQAALPAIEINRLFALLGVGVDTLKWMAFLIILVSGISVFVSLFNSLKERKYEMALMLSLGASRIQLFILLLLEGLFIGIIGYFLGILISRLGLFWMSKASEQNFHHQFDLLNLSLDDLFIFLACVFISFIAAALPSIGIYKINISETLSDQ